MTKFTVSRVYSRATACNAGQFLDEALAEYVLFHNCVRPHASLEQQTPNEYLVTLEAA